MHFYHRLSCLFCAKVDNNHLAFVPDRIPRRPDSRGYRRFPWLVDWCFSGPIVCDGGRGFGRWRLLYDTQLPRTPWFYFLFAKVHENYFTVGQSQLTIDRCFALANHFAQYSRCHLKCQIFLGEIRLLTIKFYFVSALSFLNTVKVSQ